MESSLDVTFPLLKNLWGPQVIQTHKYPKLCGWSKFDVPSLTQETNMKKMRFTFCLLPKCQTAGFKTLNDIFHLDRTDIRSFSRPLFLNHAGCRTLISRFNYIILWSIIAFNKSYLIFLMCSIFSVFLIKINLYFFFEGEN